MSDILHTNLQNKSALNWDKTQGHEFMQKSPDDSAGRQEAERKFYLTNFKAHSGLEVSWGFFESLLAKNKNVMEWYQLAKSIWVFEITKAEAYYGLNMSTDEINEVEEIANQAAQLRLEHTESVKRIMEEARQKVNDMNKQYELKVSGLPKQGLIRFVKERSLSAQDELDIAKTTDHTTKKSLISLKIIEIKRKILQQWRYEKGVKDAVKPSRVYSWFDIFF